jgi:membrane protein DedA with SNARE-associated domain
VPVFIWLGYHFAAELAWLLGKVDSVQQVVMILLGAGAVAGAGYWGYRWYQRRKQQKSTYPPVS